MTSEAPGTPEKPKDAMERLGFQISRLSTGDRARLRRMFLTRSPQAEGVVIGLLHSAGIQIPEKPEAYSPWRLVAHVGALLSGTAGHNPHAGWSRLGEALGDADYSENRMMRLTSARGRQLEGQIIRAARMLVQKKVEAINLWTVFELAGGRVDSDEQARRTIAKHYYAATRQEGEKP